MTYLPYNDLVEFLPDSEHKENFLLDCTRLNLLVCRYGGSDRAQDLLKAGITDEIYFNKEGIDGKTLLMLACKYELVGLVQYFLRTERIDVTYINRQDMLGRTALHYLKSNDSLKREIIVALNACSINISNSLLLSDAPITREKSNKFKK
jgi:ankyrin repeat protein